MIRLKHRRQKLRRVIDGRPGVGQSLGGRRVRFDRQPRAVGKTPVLPGQLAGPLVCEPNIFVFADTDRPTVLRGYLPSEVPTMNRRAAST